MKKASVLIRVAAAVAILVVPSSRLFAQVPAGAAQVIAEQSGLNAGFWTRGGSGGITEEVVSWGQTAGTQFNNAHASMRMHSTVGGTTAQGAAYLYSAPGLNASLASASLVTGSFSNPSSFSTASTVPTIVDLFGGATTLPLAAPADRTFFIVIVPAAGAPGDALAIDFGDPGTTRTTYIGGGVTVKPDQVTTAAAANPPSATTGLTNASPSTIVFSVGGFPGAPSVTASVPVGGGWVLMAMAALLSMSGLWFLRREVRQ